MPKTKNKPASIKPKRIKFREAYELIGVSRQTLQNMLDADLFTVQQDVPDGDRFLLTDELDFWVESVGTPEERQAALRSFRESKGRIRS